MSHQIRTLALEGYGKPKLIAPRLKGHVTGVALDDGNPSAPSLLFRAAPEGGARGIWREPLDTASAATCEVADGEHALFDPWPVPGGFVATLTPALGSSEAPSRVALVKGGAVVAAVPGHTFAVSKDGALVVTLEVDAGVIRTIDVARHETREVAHLPAAFDPQRAPPLAVSPSGERVLVLSTGGADQPASLLRVEVDTGLKHLAHGPLPPGTWAFGGFGDDGTEVVLEVRLGETPGTRVLRLDNGGGEVLFESPVSSPASSPLVVGGHVLVPLSLEAHPFSSSGPSDLFALALSGGVRKKLTDSGDVAGRARAAARSVVVEGGPVLWQVPTK